ncbi:hypothetical protein [Phytohabitans kaempferiae]|uniref:Lipoprotein n=1 Tax=Phytohabitans kaempferiae TaxID=1620943 RepID=A0ABV6MEA5_9ACTN
MRVRIGTALASLVLVALAACDGGPEASEVASVSGGGANPSASGSAGADGPERMRQFAQCLRDNGLPDFPDPGPDGRMSQDFDRKKLLSDAGKKALEACRDLAPNGGERGQLDPAQQDQLREWAECMRANGIDIPDPDPDTGGFLGLQEGLGIDPEDPKFQAAMEACQDKFTLRGGDR